MSTRFEIDSKHYPINSAIGSAVLIGSLMFLTGIITVINSFSVIGLSLTLLGLINLIFAFTFYSRNSIFKLNIKISKKGIYVKHNYFFKSDFYYWDEIQAFDVSKDYLEIKTFAGLKRYDLVIKSDEIDVIKKLINEEI